MLRLVNSLTSHTYFSTCSIRRVRGKRGGERKIHMVTIGRFSWSSRILIIRVCTWLSCEIYESCHGDASGTVLPLFQGHEQIVYRGGTAL